MKGNEKIASTAEGVAFMRASEKTDKYSKYFVSSKSKRRMRIISCIVPKDYLKKISQKRVRLSKELDKLIESYHPEQIIELACGYSPRGLILTQKNPNLIYVETDFSAVIAKKKRIFREIERKEEITLSKNHHLVKFDAVGKSLYGSLKKLIDRKKRTLVVAETLASYLSPSEHELLIKNVKEVLDKVKEGAYLSHEGKGMLSGFFGKLLIFYRNKVAKTRSHKHFANSKEIKNYFLKKGFKNVRVVDSEASRNFIYLTTRK